MNKVLKILSIVLLLLVVSCTHRNEASRLFEKAQSSIESAPDSALSYLDSIFLAEKFLSKEYYYDKALEKYLQSINYINKDDKEKLAGSYANISRIHLISLNNDSSIYYNDKAAVDLVENTYPKLPAMIKKNYGSLNETEYNVFLLSLLPLSSRDIANLMDLGESSVAKSRTNIRKKIGAEGYGSDIGDFILERYYISSQLSVVSYQQSVHSS